jgi:colicin import membrane protein
MTLMPNMNLHPLKPRDRSWLYITCAVVAVHSLVIGWTVVFNGAKIPDPLPKMDSRLIVQTIALNSNPIPSNPIPSNRVTPTPIPEVTITPTPLERKTMWPEKPIETPRAPDTTKPVPAPITPAVTEPPITKETPPTPTTTTLPPLRPTAKPYIKPSPTPAAKMKNAHQVPAAPKAPEKYVPPQLPEHKDVIKSALEKANEEFKAKQNEIIIKRRQELDAVKAKQSEDATRKKKEQDALKKKQEEATKKAEQLAENQRQQKFTEAQERIAKIGGSRDKIAAKTANHTLSAAPRAITNLEVDSLSNLKGEISLSHYEMSYREELAGRLKLLLRLPEYGDVKVNLTLDRTGKVAKVAIVNADSVVNRKYIEKTLPGLSFPAFGTNYASAAEYTFSITLSNEI